MDAKEVGKLMQTHRKQKGLTQDQVVERSTVPTPQYLSALENGRYDVRNSEHFKSLVSLYGLTADEVAEINPAAVINVNSDAGPSPLPRKRPIPSELAEMIEAKGHLAEELQTERWQQYLAGQRFSTGRATPERWWNLFLVLKNAGVEPGGN